MTNQITKIDTETKKILKNADNIVVRYVNEQSLIECQKMVKLDGYAADLEENIYCGTRITNYESSNEISRITFSMHSSKNRLEWITIVNNLKKNDEIYIEYIVGNSSELLKRSNIVEDIVNIIVKREGKTDLKFSFDNCICESDSIARNVKYY